MESHQVLQLCSLLSRTVPSIHNRDMTHKLITHFPKKHGETICAFAVSSLQSTRLVYERIESSMKREANNTLGARHTVETFPFNSFSTVARIRRKDVGFET